MTWFFKSNYEKILAVLAAGLLALAMVWAGRLQGGLQALAATIARGASPTGRAYAPASWRLVVPERASWPKAPEQSAGAGWLYELFTPPAVYYNSATRSFAVASPGYPAPSADGANDLPGPGVKSRLFRLQLAGYFGSPDNYLLAFVTPASGETLLARVGRRFPELGLVLIGFEVKKVPVEHGEPWPVYDVAGLATLRDELTGTEVVLDSRGPKFSEDGLTAVEAPATGEVAPPFTIAARQAAKKPAGLSVLPAHPESEREP